MSNKLTILGSGTCVSSFYNPFDYRNPAGYLVEYANNKILLDCGEGMRRQLDHLKFDYFDVDTIIISHFHPDHFSLESFLQSFFVRTFKAQKPKSIRVIGPRQIEENFITLWDLKHRKGFYNEIVRPIFHIDFQELEPHKPFSISDRITLTSFPVYHDFGKMEAYALRLQLDHNTLTYSGDSGICEGIIEAANGSHLFLCGAGANIGEDLSLTAGHLNPFQAGEIAHKASAKQILLTHLPAKDSPKQIYQEAKRSGYKGIVKIMSDFDEVEINF